MLHPAKLKYHVPASLAGGRSGATPRSEFAQPRGWLTRSTCSPATDSQEWLGLCWQTCSRRSSQTPRAVMDGSRHLRPRGRTARGGARRSRERRGRPVPGAARGERVLVSVVGWSRRSRLPPSARRPRAAPSARRAEQDRDLTLAQEALRVCVRSVPGRDHELGIPRRPRRRRSAYRSARYRRPSLRAARAPRPR